MATRPKGDRHKHPSLTVRLGPAQAQLEALAVNFGVTPHALAKGVIISFLHEHERALSISEDSCADNPLTDAYTARFNVAGTSTD